MSDPAYALQAAIVAALKGNTDAGNSVFDSVPSSDPFPRIVIGTTQTIADDADCYDGSECFTQIDVYSDKTASMPEVKAIASQIQDLLNDADLDLEGHILSEIRVRDVVYSREPDGKRGRARLNLRTLSQSEQS